MLIFTLPLPRAVRLRAALRGSPYALVFNRGVL